MRIRCSGVRPRAGAAISAIAVLAGMAIAVAPAASAQTSLYTSRPVGGGVSPATCTSDMGSSMCLAGSANWSGYWAVGSWSGASFINAQASFSVPSVRCAETSTGYADHWAGLGGEGFGSSNGTGLESVGIAEQCADGTPSYQAWWETYPQPQTDVFTVSPGDAITADVSYDITSDAHQGQYHFALTDVTTGQNFSMWEPCAASSCLNSSAEVISSAPSDANDGQPASILSLADYGVANFEGASMTDHGNQSGGFISSAWPQFFQVTQSDNPQTGTILASPGSLYGGQAYSNTWHAAN
jgi:hypothetical protein